MPAPIYPENYGCVGDGVTDDTAALQAALDAAALAGAALVNRAGATYLCGALVISGAQVWDINNSTILAAPSLSTTQPLLTNKTVTGQVNWTYDNNIRVVNGIFQCASGADRDAAFLLFRKCGGLVISNIKVIGPQFIGIACAGCKEVRLHDVEATGTGRLVVTAEGGPAIWLGSDDDGSTCNSVWIDSPFIYGTNWAALYANGLDCRVTSPRFINVKEAGIFCNAQSSGLQVVGGIIDGVTRKNISASGIEAGGVYHTLGGGLTIKNTDNCSISLADTQNVLINGVSSVNARRDAITFPGASHVSIISHGCGVGASSPRDITVAGHMAVDYQKPSLAAVVVDGTAPGAAQTGVAIIGNNYAGSGFSSGSPIKINPTYWNSVSCLHAKNNGAGD